MKATAGRLSVITAYFLIYVVWGSTYYFISVALEGLPTFLLGALRFSAAGLLLLSFCGICRGESVFRAQLIRRSAVSGIVLLFVDMAVIMLAQRYVSSSLVAIVASSTAIWIMLLDAPMWRTNFRSRHTLCGVILGFVGVGLLGHALCQIPLVSRRGCKRICRLSLANADSKPDVLALCRTLRQLLLR